MRKKYVARSTFYGKQNFDSVLQTHAQEKLNTFSEDVTEVSRNIADQFSGWADDNILLERVNRKEKSTRSTFYQTRRNEDSTIKIFANRRAMESKRRIIQELIQQDCKTGIYLLKKQAEFLEAPSTAGTIGDRGKFPKKEDLLNTTKSSRTPQMHCYPTHNNFFSSRQKYSERESNRQKIKNIRKLSLKYPHNFSSLLMTPVLHKVRVKERKMQRPSSSSGNHTHKTHRVHSEKADYNQVQPIAELESSRPRYIPSSFKKCRMNKRNKSARANLSEPSDLNETIPNDSKNAHIKGKRIKPSGPLDDLLKIRFPDFF